VEYGMGGRSSKNLKLKNRAFLAFIFTLLFLSAIFISIPACNDDDDDSGDSETEINCADENESCMNLPCCLGLMQDFEVDSEGNKICFCPTRDSVCEVLNQALIDCGFSEGTTCPLTADLAVDCYFYAKYLDCEMFEFCMEVLIL
jgi:hypothetical protein